MAAVIIYQNGGQENGSLKVPTGIIIIIILIIYKFCPVSNYVSKILETRFNLTGRLYIKIVLVVRMGPVG